jgi:DNA polymerase kappa
MASASRPKPAAAAGGVSFTDRAKSLYVHASHKGGMDGIDTEQIAKVVLETASNSAYTSHQRKLDDAVERRIARVRDLQRRLDHVQRGEAQAAVARRTAELEASRDLRRVCVVIDFDMFYAAVALRDAPELADQPLAVGGALVLTANYVARRWGVRSGMPGFVAKELCRRGPEFGMPSVELIFVPADYPKYAQVAETAMGIYREYDPHTAMGYPRSGSNPGPASVIS